MDAFAVPGLLAETWRDEPDWLRELPRRVSECAALWGLTLESPVETPHSLVVPAGPVVLKLNAPSHVEADHEADALARWDGDGAVRLLARDDGRRALLIERCVPGTRLWDVDVDGAPVVAELLLRLRVDLDQPHPFRLLAAEAERWIEEVPKRWELGGRPFERELLDLALDVFRSVDPTAASLVNQDLHGGNVLKAERQPWLLIDPKPLAGERELDGVGVLRNAAWETHSSPRAVRQWLDVLASTGLDRERLRGWGIAHTLAWASDGQGRWHASSLRAAQTILAA
jgi:streptomycin 6-kinase